MRMALAFQRAGTHLPRFSLSLCRRKGTDMKTSIFVVLGMVIFLFGFVRSLRKRRWPRRSSQKVVQKVQEAAKSLSQSGEAGLAQFDKRESPSVRPKTPFFARG